MTDQNRKAASFAALHKPGSPLILYNIWDVGSALALCEAGAPAIATGSWSVAAAQGYDDGEAMPLEELLTSAQRIAGATDLPVTIDFEGAYAVEPEGVAANAQRLLATGAVGCNFEDRIVDGEGLYAMDDQVRRIRAMRQAVRPGLEGFFINARTDLFLQEGDRSRHAGLLPAAMERARAYAEAGASGFFAPGLAGLEEIAALAEASPLPLNVMALPDLVPGPELAATGVSRVSFGGAPHRAAMADITRRAAAFYAAP